MGRKGRVVPSAVFRVQDQRDVKDSGFQFRVFRIGRSMCRMFSAVESSGFGVWIKRLSPPK
jgi:hypothetical protein